jgi:hypothetical protein
MSSLYTEEIVVHDISGRPTPAMLQVCKCGGREWLVYAIEVHGKDHPHMQCVACGECYWDGACAAAREHYPERN